MSRRDNNAQARQSGNSAARDGALPRSLDAVQATTRRLQLRAVFKQLKPDWNSVSMAIKTSIPPTVLVCAIQSDTWINYFKTNAYLAPIISACALPALPRAKLIEYNLQLAFAFTISYCWVLLAGWSALQARKHTTRDAADLENYNSSAEAVVILFLIFGMWCSFTLKSAHPAWALQCTLAAIFAVAVLPSVARISTMSKIISEVNNTLEAFLAGQAVGLVNALIVFPQSCRGVFKKDLKVCLNELGAVMQAQRKCMEDFRIMNTSAAGEDQRISSIKQLEAALQRFINSVVKARSDVEYAEREIAWDRLDHSHLEYIAARLVDLIPPVSGLSTAANMLQQALDQDRSLQTPEEASYRLDRQDDSENEKAWHHLEQRMNSHSSQLSQAIIEGVEHAKLRLELTKESPVLRRMHKKMDEEKPVHALNPGEPQFLQSYRDAFTKCCVFGDNRAGMADEKLTEHYIRHRPQVTDLAQVTTEAHTDIIRYFLLLHSQALLSSTGDELFKLLLFIEECHSQPKRFQMPRMHRVHYWTSLFFKLVGTGSTEHLHDMQHDVDIQLGSAFYSWKNPDHLPPTTFMQSIGDKVRKISVLFRSEHAAYGLRGACAVMTIAIIGFLRSSQEFYFKQRFLWALFAILLSLSRTAGSSTFLLLGRVLGTMASMTASYIIWYMVDQKVAGILVFLWIWFLIIGYLFVKFPKFFAIWFVALIAAIVMIANELQVRQLGKATVEQLGQAVYKPYIIFPYRLAVVTLGVLTAYFWTIFPYPLSEHSELRERVAKATYILATYYMTVQQTVLARLHGTFGDAEDKTSHSFHMQTARRRIFRKYQTLSTTAKTFYQFLDWEFALGGRFPKQTYGEMLSILERIASYMTLIGYVSRALQRPSSSPDLNSSNGRSTASSSSTSWWWLNDVSSSADAGDTVQTHLIPPGITTRMIILHSALARAHPLPPELHDLTIPNLSDFLTRTAPSRNVEKHQQSQESSEVFAAAALIHSVNWYMVKDLNRLTDLVKELVGELDFSMGMDDDDSRKTDGEESMSRETS